ncbi:MAG: DUF1553 domain-containing protein [Planctomycetota bacterium]
MTLNCGVRDRSTRNRFDMHAARLFVVLILVSAGAVNADEGVDSEEATLLENTARAILEKHCVDCHGNDESNGGLRLDTADSLNAVGDSGKQAIVPGDLEASELLVRVLSKDENTRMPPDGDRLADEEIESLREWIGQGAPWTGDPRAARQLDPRTRHWAFQPIANPDVPRRIDAWSSHPVDRFLEAARADAGKTVVEDASPRVMIRRLFYDLIGLPPSTDDVVAFEANWKASGPDHAITQIVDQLLARNEYGERWGRHWMDWVRYADTAGDNSDYPIPQAYLYRNYIIDSLNSDAPYDRFLIEQLAGDLMPAKNEPERVRQTIATGYLAMARRFGSLIERYPWHLTIEDTIDNVGKTMLGMTLACARCHDHKFDPVSTREYYGLYGFFASTRYPFPGIELFKAQNHFASLLPEEQTKAHLAKFADKTSDLQRQLTEILALCELKAQDNARQSASASVDDQRRMRSELDGMLIKARNKGETLAKHLQSIPEYPTAYAVSDANAIDASIQIKGEPTRPGAVVPRQFPDVLGGQKLPATAEGSGRLELANWVASKDNPLTARVIVNRVWAKYLGRGIVPSTTDFGLRGQTPTHPQLLDWLATDFIAHGWSLKHLHRTLLTSRTYRLSSNDNVDPENIHLTHQRRKRLDAESIRDTMLFLSGELDTTPMNETHPFPPRKEWKFTQHHPFKDAYDSRRRSVYLMTKRLTADQYFQTFDGPDRNVCTQTRDQSITALQALYFVNNEFLHDSAQALANRLPKSLPDEAKLQWLMQHLLQRSATPMEQAWLLEHLTSARQNVSEQQAWASLARSLFRLNEFLYID